MVSSAASRVRRAFPGSRLFARLPPLVAKRPWSVCTEAGLATPELLRGGGSRAPSERGGLNVGRSTVGRGVLQSPASLAHVQMQGRLKMRQLREMAIENRGMSCRENPRPVTFPDRAPQAGPRVLSCASSTTRPSHRRAKLPQSQWSRPKLSPHRMIQSDLIPR